MKRNSTNPSISLLCLLIYTVHQSKVWSHSEEHMKQLLSTIAIVLILLTLSPLGYSQTEIGECSVEPEIGDSMYRIVGKGYRKRDMPIDLQQALCDAELQYYKAQKTIIDQSILVSEVDRLADESGQSVEETITSLFETDLPTEQRVKEIYDQNKSRIKSPLEEIEERIIQALMQRDVQEKQMEMLNDLKQKSGFELTLPKPIAPHAEQAIDGFPRNGAAEPSVVIVEFADYQCPHCKQATSILSAMAERYPDDVAVVHVDFPINRSGVSRIVVQGAVCAGEQDKFWYYHDQAFEQQDSLNRNSPVKIAEVLGLDKELFQKRIISPQPVQHVARGEQDALRLGLTSTPTLFLSGRRLHLHDMATELATEIETALNDKS